MDLETNANLEREFLNYLEGSARKTLIATRKNLCNIRDQFINSSKTYENSVNYEWIKIDDQFIAELILKAFADNDKKMILDATLDRPKTPVEILDVCKIPPTSGYRKIKSLIRDGLLIPRGAFLARSRRQVRRYITAVENIKIEIDKGNLVVKVKFTKTGP